MQACAERLFSDLHLKDFKCCMSLKCTVSWNSPYFSFQRMHWFGTGDWHKVSAPRTRIPVPYVRTQQYVIGHRCHRPAEHRSEAELGCGELRTGRVPDQTCARPAGSPDLPQGRKLNIHNDFLTSVTLSIRSVFVLSYHVTEAAWQQLYLFLFPCRCFFFKHISWWGNFTASINKLLVAVENGQFLIILRTWPETTFWNTRHGFLRSKRGKGGTKCQGCLGFLFCSCFRVGKIMTHTPLKIPFVWP